MAERPRIVLLVTLGGTGGAQTYVASLLPALSGFDVTVAAHGAGRLRDAATAAGARFVALRHVRRAIHPWRDLRGLIELTSLLRRERPHVLHASSSKAGVLGRLAAALAGVPIRVFTVHGWAFAAHDGVAARLYRVADRFASRLTTATICVSELERRTGLQARTCTAGTTSVIPTGVQLAEPGGQDRPERVRPRIVAVGRLQAPKDALTLVRALALLERGTFEALLVGDGPDRPVVEAEVRRLGLGGAVELVGERHDVPELLASADLFVLSSRSEGLPVSILEAMAAGLPVVAADVGGVAELVVSGRTGVLVPPADEVSLAAAIRQLVADPVRRRELGRAGRTRVRESFDLAAFRRSHLDLYCRELAARGLPLPSP